MKKIIYLFILSMFILTACKNSSVSNTNFKTNLTIDSKGEEKKSKVEELEKSISVKKDSYINYYYSNKDSFVKDRGYTFYITPYIVEETGMVNRISLRIFIKAVSEKENIFDKITFYDEKGNRVSINFSKITKNYTNDTGFIEESGHGLINDKDLKVFEKFIDSQELFVILEKNEKYVLKLPYPVRNAVLDIIRKYKLLEESY